MNTTYHSLIFECFEIYAHIVHVRTYVNVFSKLHILSLSCVGKCPTIKLPKNGTADPLTDHVVGDNVTYICNEGFDLMGNETTLCIDLGSRAIWESGPPTCQGTYIYIYVL